MSVSAVEERVKTMRTALPEYVGIMRLTLDHWALVCSSCSNKVFVLNRKDFETVSLFTDHELQYHVMECGLRRGAPLEQMREVIVSHVASGEMAERVLVLLDILWRRFAGARYWPSLYVAERTDGIAQLDVRVHVLAYWFSILVGPDEGDGFTVLRRSLDDDVSERHVMTLDELYSFLSA